MKPRAEDERRKRRRGHPLRAAVVAVWAVGAVVALVAAYGPFWRDVGYWMERAQTHAERQEWSEALRFVGRALDGAPEDPDILTFAGYLHGAVEAWPEAAGRFQQALQVDPGRPEPSLGLAEARLEQNDRSGTASALSEMRLADANADQRARAVGLAEAAGRPDLALELLDAPPGTASDVETRRTRARLVHAAGREDEASERFSALHRDGILDQEGALTYAWMLNERGQHADALQVLEAVPGSDETHELAARTALWADQLARAGTHIEALPPGSGATQELYALLGAAEEHRVRAQAEAAARAEAEAEFARRRDTPPADPREALNFWWSRLNADPLDSGARAEVVALLEASSRFDEALEVLFAGDPLEEVATEGGARAVHAARLSLWAERPDDAVRLLEPAGGPAGLLARGQFEAGDAEAAYRTLSNVQLADASTLLLKARVADAAGRPAEAAESLAALARVRTLATEEQRWWAGLLWRSGGLDGALAGYEGLRELMPEDPSIHRAIGDLRLALDDPEGAEIGYREAVRLGGPTDPAGAGLALALLRQDRQQEAVNAYAEYLESVPDDGQARLALARALAGEGAFDQAAPEYERALGPAIEAEPRLSGEVASAWMATGAYARAEPWARRAASDPNAPLARARFAHLLGLMHRYAEARAAVDALAAEWSEERTDAASLEDAFVRAWIHRLQGRPLAALDVLEAPLARDDTSRLAVEARIFRSEVREARGDVARARTSVTAARDSGARDTDVQHVERALERRAGPRAEAGLQTGSDARELDVTTIWGRARLRPATLGSPALSMDVRHRSASQLGATDDGTAFAVDADSLFVSEALRLDGRFGLETSEGGGTRLMGALGATWETRRALQWSLEVSRVPVWSEAERRDAPEYARISNLASLDSRLMVNEFRTTLSTTRRSPIASNGYAEIGAARYSDGNDRAFGYAQWRVPVHANEDAIIALAPNVYVEGYRDTRSSYASPSSFVALGLAVEGNRSFGSLSIDGRANPHAYRLPDTSGLGIEGRVGLTLGTEIGNVRLEGRYLKQGGLYDLFRLGTEVSLPFGGARR